MQWCKVVPVACTINNFTQIPARHQEEASLAPNERHTHAQTNRPARKARPKSRPARQSDSPANESAVWAHFRHFRRALNARKVADLAAREARLLVCPKTAD